LEVFCETESIHKGTFKLIFRDYHCCWCVH
jgi:hypothetical protein